MSRSIWLTGTDGVGWDLTVGPVKALTSPTLWGLPAVRLSEQERALTPGSVVTSARYGARDLIVPVSIRSSGSPHDIDDTLGELVRSVDPAVGDGVMTLTVVRDDGTTRSIDVLYVDGLAALTTVTQNGREIRGALALRAPWPFWRSGSGSPTTVTYTPSATNVAYNVAAAYDDENLVYAPNIARMYSVSNNGDRDAWPTCTFRGPGSSIRVDNLTTGEWWEYTGVLAAGEVLEVVTRPGRTSVRLDGALSLALLADGSTLFGLRAQSPAMIAVRVDGYVAGTSQASLSWREEWLTC